MISTGIFRQEFEPLNMIHIRRFGLLLTLSLFFHFLQGQSFPLIQNVQGRNITTLNGTWHYIIDPYETGYYDYRYMPYDADPDRKNSEAAYYNHAKPKNKQDRIEYDFDASPTLLIPGDWNSQDPKLLYYEGTIWLKTSFDLDKSRPENRVFIHFGAVNYIAEVYLNGEKLGVHTGGFTPFNFEVTDVVKPRENFLIVKVDNTRSREGVPTLNTDWWNYGGITRDVTLIETDPVFIVDYKLNLVRDTKNEIEGHIAIDGSIPTRSITIAIPELNVRTTLEMTVEKEVFFRVKVDQLKLWTPEDPKLYEVILSTGEESVRDEIGFRQIEVRGRDILLNGNPVFLRGISMHEENPMRGARAFSETDALTAIHWARELNCNFIRLAHYPHNENIVRLADRLGILLWEENPVYWTIDFQNKATLENAKNQLREMISRDKNRASVIIWSMANETPESAARNEFLRSLIQLARKSDGTRLISAALQHRSENGINILDDAIMQFVDIVSFNQYIGWYGGTPDQIPGVKWHFDQAKPVIISEFGAGALAGFHGEKDERWTEEYQAYLYEKTIEMMKNMPELRGVSPWILADFRSPKRNLPIIQDGWNRKGLISNNGQKKKAFYVLQNYYREVEEATR